MSLLNDASLVLIPSGYKEDKVYSIIPSDGSGDLDFVRGSDGTRINSLGQVENVCWNLLQYSEQFNNAFWLKYVSTISANTTTAPNGTLTADTLTSDSGSYGVLYISQQFVAGQNITFSIYAKANTSNILQLGTTDNGIDYKGIFNLSNGTITSTSGVTASIENAGNGWYRCSVNRTMVGNANMFIVEGDSSKNFYIWGAQANVGSTAKPYFPTTDRLNVPRLTYENGCPSLLLEKQSTNIIPYSQDFDHSSWAKTQFTITANSVISPDGTQNAETITNNGTNNIPEFYKLVNGSAIQYTYSAYFKANTHTKALLRCYNQGTTSTPMATFDLSNGTVLNTYGDASNPTIKSVGNGWYRCSMTFTSLSSTLYPQLQNLADSATFDSSYNYFYNYSTVGSIYIWGAQLEASAYPTSYIPTTSTAVTRLADSCYKTGISSLIGQTEGTILVDWVQNAFSNSQGIYANNYNLTGSISIQISTNGTIQAFVCYANTYFSIASSANAIQLGQRYKVGFVYKSGDCALYLNGNLIGTSNITFAFTTSLNEIDLSNRTVFFANLSEISINQMLQFKTRITDTELAQLTTI